MVVFVLGSGISIDAGMPSVHAITAQVVSGEGAYLDTAQVFGIAPDTSHTAYQQYHKRAAPVLALVHNLCTRAASYLERDPTYEEIAQFARQIEDTLSREYETPALEPLVAELLERHCTTGDRACLGELCMRVHHYVADTVHHLLARQPSRLDHLGAIVAACRAQLRVVLATLNHDVVLEAVLHAAQLTYADGFEQSNEDVRFWLDEWGEPRIRLLKLHGSVDWWDYRLRDEPWRRWVTARFQGVDPLKPNRPGVAWDPRDHRPVFLTGTFDKILAYETSIFPDQHFRFHEALRDANRVVVIGYSFGDKALNTRVIRWMLSDRDKQLIVCHPEPDRLVAGARGAIRNHWPAWLAERRLALISTLVADLDYDMLASHLG